MKIIISLIILGMVSGVAYSVCHKKHNKHCVRGVPCCYVQEKRIYQLWPYSWGPTNECISERKREVHKPNCGI